MRVLLADDDPHVRSALRLLLENEPGVSIVGESATADGLTDLVTGSRATVVLLDWELPGLRAGNEVQRLRSTFPACRVVALSGRPEHEIEALRAGVTRFVCKVDAPEVLMHVLGELHVWDAEAEPDDHPEQNVRRPEALEVVQYGVQQPRA
jgi:DNA-binding NarL/FixJ family response regulator